MRGFAVVALLLGACTFTPGQFTGDAGDDQPPDVTVGFAAASTLADETSATLSIHVTLSGPSEETVTVAYAASGGTATKDDDYTITDGTLTFAPGDIDETIEVTIKADGEVESDETIDLALSSPTGASLGQAAHVINISANTLPRVSFMTPTSASTEDMSTTLVVALDTTPLVPVSVELVGTGTATGAGTDYTLSTTMLTFDANTTTLMQTVDLTVNNDALDENDEDAVIDFANGVNVIVASTNATRTHSIQDNDDPPHVNFALGPASSVGEGTAMVDISVTLDAPSGKDISIDFSVDGASSATGGGTDYTLGTTSPLMFPAGMTTKTIRVNINNDTAVELPETVVITLDNLAANPNVQAGTDTTHTLTITDNDGTCFGTGSYTACFATANGTKNINSDINTDSGATGCVTPDAGWTGQPATCFIVAANINVNGAIKVTGTKPLAFIAGTNLAITANIDASSSVLAATTRSGAGAGTGCPAYTDNPTVGNTGNGNGAGGGAGGSFRSAGGDGGDGGVGNNSAGTATGAVGAPTMLRGGCAGQNGGTYNGGAAGAAGPGGGALYLVAGNQLSISSGTWINVSGGGAKAAGNRGGGGGGGSGGMILLHAASFSTNGAKLVANGGGGSKGGDSNDNGSNGSDPDPANPATAAGGGTSGNGGGNGGNGYPSASIDGGSGSSDNAGGGGGGGGGHISANGSLGTAVISAGGS